MLGDFHCRAHRANELYKLGLTVGVKERESPEVSAARIPQTGPPLGQSSEMDGGVVFKLFEWVFIGILTEFEKFADEVVVRLLNIVGDNTAILHKKRFEVIVKASRSSWVATRIRLVTGLNVSRSRHATHVDSQHREDLGAHRIELAGLLKKRPGNRNPLMLPPGWLGGSVVEMPKADRFKVCKHQTHRVLGFSLSL